MWREDGGPVEGLDGGPVEGLCDGPVEGLCGSLAGLWRD